MCCIKLNIRWCVKFKVKIIKGIESDGIEKNYRMFIDLLRENGIFIFSSKDKY